MNKLDMLNIISNKVDDYVGKNSCVRYSAYKLDKKDNPINNLEDIPVEGKVKIICPENSWTTAEYESSVLNSPTWLELCKIAEEQIRITRDNHHIFLENISVVSIEKKKDGIKICEFSMGS